MNSGFVVASEMRPELDHLRMMPRSPVSMLSTVICASCASCELADTFTGGAVAAAAEAQMRPPFLALLQQSGACGIEGYDAAAIEVRRRGTPALIFARNQPSPDRSPVR
jgi:hypothetical protein